MLQKYPIHKIRPNHHSSSDNNYSGIPSSEADPPEHDLLQLLALVNPVERDEGGRHHVQQVAAGSPQPEVGPQDVDDAAGPHADGEAAHTDQDTLILDNLAMNINQKSRTVLANLFSFCETEWIVL